jgi:hypothetical protein
VNPKYTPLKKILPVPLPLHRQNLQRELQSWQRWFAAFAKKDPWLFIFSPCCKRVPMCHFFSGPTYCLFFTWSMDKTHKEKKQICCGRFPVLDNLKRMLVETCTSWLTPTTCFSRFPLIVSLFGWHSESRSIELKKCTGPCCGCQPGWDLS